MYGNPYRVDKRDFWNWMSRVLQPTEEPGFCGGDLNEFLLDHKKSGDRDEVHTLPCLLHEFMPKMELIDLGFNGPQFTWRGTRNNSLVQERLDHGPVNGIWQTLWPRMSVTHGIVRGSNPCPIVINTNLVQMKRRKLFKFEACWLMEERY